MTEQSAEKDARRAVLATRFRQAADRCCQCTDGHHDWFPDYPYGTDGDVRTIAANHATAVRLADWHVARHQAEVCPCCSHMPPIPTATVASNDRSLMKVGDEVYRVGATKIAKVPA